MQEDIELKGEYHYCPSCGDATIFESEGLYDYIGSIDLPNLLTYDNAKYEDYIEVLIYLSTKLKKERTNIRSVLLYG